MSNLIQLDDHRPKPQIKIRKLDKGVLVKQMNASYVFNAELKTADKITDPVKRIKAHAEAWIKYQGKLAYEMLPK